MRFYAKLDENSYVRMTTARSLGEIEDPRVMEPLMQALKDESHGVRKNALLSLKKRTGQDLGKEPAAWLKWWEENK
jgi:HEAT repeat protein